MMIIWDEHEWIILNYASQVYWALLLLAVFATSQPSQSVLVKC